MDELYVRVNILSGNGSILGLYKLYHSLLQLDPVTGCQLCFELVPTKFAEV
jgi:hypothetical protein